MKAPHLGATLSPPCMRKPVPCWPEWPSVPGSHASPPASAHPHCPPLLFTEAIAFRQQKAERAEMEPVSVPLASPTTLRQRQEEPGAHDQNEQLGSIHHEPPFQELGPVGLAADRQPCVVPVGKPHSFSNSP